MIHSEKGNCYLTLKRLISNCNADHRLKDMKQNQDALL